MQWKGHRPQLPDNRQMAESHLLGTEKNLKKKAIDEREYKKTIETCVEKGYLRQVPENEAPPPEVWYLPHLIVKMSKSTTKVRTVFDCSAKCKGISLNDVIHAGPKLQRELFDVLICFRCNPVALVCDIQEMYLQIAIEPEDRRLFQILWRDGETGATQMSTNSLELFSERTQFLSKASSLSRRMPGVTKPSSHYLQKLYFNPPTWMIR